VEATPAAPPATVGGGDPPREPDVIGDCEVGLFQADIDHSGYQLPPIHCVHARWAPTITDSVDFVDETL